MIRSAIFLLSALVLTVVSQNIEDVLRSKCTQNALLNFLSDYYDLPEYTESKLVVGINGIVCNQFESGSCIARLVCSEGSYAGPIIFSCFKQGWVLWELPFGRPSCEFPDFHLSMRGHSRLTIEGIGSDITTVQLGTQKAQILKWKSGFPVVDAKELFRNRKIVGKRVPLSVGETVQDLQFVGSYKIEPPRHCTKISLTRALQKYYSMSRAEIRSLKISPVQCIYRRAECSATVSCVSGSPKNLSNKLFTMLCGHGRWMMWNRGVARPECPMTEIEASRAYTSKYNGKPCTQRGLKSALIGSEDLRLTSAELRKMEVIHFKCRDIFTRCEARLKCNGNQVYSGPVNFKCRSGVWWSKGSSRPKCTEPQVDMRCSQFGLKRTIRKKIHSMSSRSLRQFKVEEMYCSDENFCSTRLTCKGGLTNFGTEDYRCDRRTNEWQVRDIDVPGPCST
eukprot:178235_1